MRVLGAVRGTARIASEDIEYRDVLFPAGTLVAISLASANFDGDVMETPDRFDITRKQPAQQMTFGSGIHRCAGSNLARLEMRAALQVFLERIPEFELVDPTAVTWAGGQVHGPRRCEVRFEVPTT